MPLSDAERKLLKDGPKALEEALAFRRTLKEELHDDAIRRRKIAARFRQGLIDRAFAAAGIDQKELKRRQLLEHQSAKRSLTQKRPAIQAHVKQVQQQQRARAAKIAKHYQALGSSQQAASNSPVVAILDMPSKISILRDEGTGTIVTPASWNTRLRTKLAIRDGFQTVTCYYSFVWTPPRDGLLSPHGWVSGNGTTEWSFEGSCIPDQYGGNVSASAILHVQQLDLDGFSLSSSSAVSLGRAAFGHSGIDCLGEVGVDSFDEFAWLEFSTGTPVSGNFPVLLTVAVVVSTYGDGASGYLDYASPGREINVLGLILNTAS